MIKQVAALLAVVAVITVGASPVVSANGGHNNNVGKKIHLTLEKDWVVADDPDDLFNEDDVEVDFDVKIYRNHQFSHEVSINEGDSFEVKKNDFIVIEEDVTDFPDDCDYTAKGLETGIWVSDDHHTHTVVNTVSCDEEDDEDDEEEPAVTEEKKTTTPKVSGAVTTNSEQQQVVAPAGGVDAGVGGAGSAGAVAGVFTSVAAAGVGLVARKRAALN